MVQEHERAVGGWQAEWATIARVVQIPAWRWPPWREVAEGLTVDPRRMRANIEATRGVDLRRARHDAAGPELGRDVAHNSGRSHAPRHETGRKLKEVLAEIPEVTRVLTPAQIDDLDSPEPYLGAAEIFRQQLLEASE